MPFVIRGERSEFKSYYVVWKHFLRCLNIPTVLEFKSYYVVWKPQKIAPKIAEKVKFKSYYVVWKRRGA